MNDSERGGRTSPVVARRELRRRLVAARLVHFGTREEAAKALGWSKRTQDTLETGESLPSPSQLDAVFAVLGVSSSDQQRWIELAAQARRRGWWSAHDDADVSKGTKTFIGYEAGATRVRVFSGAFVAALLQTREYRASLLANQAGIAAPEHIEQRLDVLARRQAALDSPDPLEYHLIIDESALYRDAGPGVMSGQLGHLIDLAENAAHVTVQVVPYSAGLYRALSDTFTLLEFGQPGDGLGYIESAAAKDHYVEGPALYGYSATFEELAQQRAQSPDETVGTLRRAQKLTTRSHR
jgi:transcriptional regulator with XRE-family HTH domain